MAALPLSRPETPQTTSHFHLLTQHNGFSEKLCKRPFLLWWRLCCVRGTPPAAVPGHPSLFGAHFRLACWLEVDVCVVYCCMRWFVVFDLFVCVPHGMKERQRGAEEERKGKEKQKTSETHVGQHAHSSSQRSDPLWHSTVQKSGDSKAHSKRPGSRKAHNRVRQRKLKSVVKERTEPGGPEPVLETGEERALRHNTTRRSLNHDHRSERCGHLEVHNRF